MINFTKRLLRRALRSAGYEVSRRKACPDPALRRSTGDSFVFKGIEPNDDEIEDELARLAALSVASEPVTELLGSRLRIHSPAVFPYLYREIWQRGIYSFPCPSPSPRIIDAGANIGLATLYFRRHYPGARITALEPVPDIAEILEENLRSFGFFDVVVMRCALGKQSGVGRFLADPQGTAGHVSENGNLRVDLVSLSELIGEERVDFLKLDIEGAEYEVLEECESRLPLVNHLFVELHTRIDETQRLDEAFEILRRTGFRVQLETASAIVKQPFQRGFRHKGMDVLLNVYASRTPS